MANGKKQKKITVLIIDDSALMRRELTRIANSDDRLITVETAADGEEGLEKIKKTDPDVVTIDVNLPGMDGISCLQHIMIESPRPCVMLSAYTKKDSLETFEALELGAVDFIEKPSGEISRDIHLIGQDICDKIAQAAGVNLYALSRFKPTTQKHEILKKTHSKANIETVVVIGVSTGGPRTLMQILPGFPEDFSAPILVVQHMPEKFTASFAKRLNEYCQLEVVEAKHNDILSPQTVYVAKGGHHLLLKKNAQNIVLELNKPDKKDLFVPGVDITLHSAIDIFGDQVVGIILTGMGNDGVSALQRLYRLGGETIAEAEETAVIYGMPKEAIDIGVAKHIAPAHHISGLVLGVMNYERKNRS